MSVRFNEAIAVATRYLADHGELGSRRLLIRDLWGRIRIYVDGASADDLALHAAALHPLLGAWSTAAAGVFADAGVFFTFDRMWVDPDARVLDGRTRWLDRRLIGADWLRDPLPDLEPTVPRVVLYGVKGGVGRSTALAVWARHLSERGQRVLVVDLDLEAPGVGSLLLPMGELPDFGVVDWFVEEAVGQGAEILAGTTRRSPLSADGDIIVVPAAGLDTGDYLAKLARIYQGDPTSGRDFGGRLASLIDALEAAVNPDIVLLDSRSGLHDVAAVTLSRLGAYCLLFAIDTPQTWAAYRALLAPWADRAIRETGSMDGVRQRLQVVAAQVPETGRLEYLSRFRAHAYDVFSAIYDADLEAETPLAEAFTFDVDAEGAPHNPVPVYWSRAFIDWDPVGRPDATTDDQLSAAFGSFAARTAEWVLPGVRRP